MYECPCICTCKIISCSHQDIILCNCSILPSPSSSSCVGQRWRDFKNGYRDDGFNCFNAKCKSHAIPGEFIFPCPKQQELWVPTSKAAHISKLERGGTDWPGSVRWFVDEPKPGKSAERRAGPLKRKSSFNRDGWTTVPPATKRLFAVLPPLPGVCCLLSAVSYQRFQGRLTGKVASLLGTLPSKGVNIKQTFHLSIPYQVWVETPDWMILKVSCS